MAPDLNSLPPSRSPSISSSPRQLRMSVSSQDHFRPRNQTPPPSSLAAAATINAGMQNHDSRRSSVSSNRHRGPSIPGLGNQRRRSSAVLNLNGYEPSMPSPGELQRAMSETRSPLATADPHHQRAPSIGELHQQLESEQEAQVNRLLRMIRLQQAQIQQMQASQPMATGNTNGSASAAVVDDSAPPTPSTTHPPSALGHAPSPPTAVFIRPRSPMPRSGSYDLSRQSSRRSRANSHFNSPLLVPLSTSTSNHNEPGEFLAGAGGMGETRGSRDETAFHQAEAAMLTRENQMLKMRIRELERQIQQLRRVHSPSTVPGTGQEADSSTSDMKID